jgi:hypothetical protein
MDMPGEHGGAEDVKGVARPHAKDGRLQNFLVSGPPDFPG